MGYSVVPLTESEIKHSEICPCPKPSEEKGEKDALEN